MSQHPPFQRVLVVTAVLWVAYLTATLSITFRSFLTPPSSVTRDGFYFSSVETERHAPPPSTSRNESSFKFLDLRAGPTPTPTQSSTPSGRASTTPSTTAQIRGILTGRDSVFDKFTGSFNIAAPPSSAFESQRNDQDVAIAASFKWEPLASVVRELRKPIRRLRKVAELGKQTYWAFRMAIQGILEGVGDKSN
jgi:hypothetical protein